MPEYDVAVVGAGIHGSAVAYYAARHGARVLLLDQFGPDHTEGSSHGETRIFRTAYLEGGHYVPLTRRAQLLWRELARDSQAELIVRTGALMLGLPDGEAVGGSRKNAIAHQLGHQVLSAEEVHHRFPVFAPHPNESALLDPEAGFLYAARCWKALREGAERRGAEVRSGERVKGWSVTGGRTDLRTSQGEVRARSLVLAAGPWMGTLVPELASCLSLERQVVVFLDPPDPSIARPPTMPPFIWEAEEGSTFYGIPDVGEGVKVAHHGGTPVARPEATERKVSAEDQAPVRAFVTDRVPGANGPVRGTTTCLYTMAPGSNFVIGPHPGHPSVWLVSACSGHGFKFASAVGEAVACGVLGTPSPTDLAPFRPEKVWPA